MTQQLDNGFGTFMTAEAIEAFSLVKLSSTTDKTVAKVGAGQASIGVTQHYAANATPVTVKLWNAGGYFLCRAGAAITNRNSTLYAGADGTVKNTATGPKVGYSLDSAGAAEDLVEVLPTASLSPGSATINDNAGGTTGGTLTLVALATKALAEGTLGGTTGGTALMKKLRGTGYSAGLIADISDNLQVLRAAVIERDVSLPKNLRVLAKAMETAGIASVI